MLKIERLSPSHDVDRFDCGSEILNNILKKRTRQHAERNVSRTYVLIGEERSRQILGYLTLTLCELFLHTNSENRVAAKLSRLATAQAAQHLGYGSLLVIYAMERVAEIAERMGLVGLYVDLKDEEASGYYRQFDFIKLKKSERTLFLPTEVIRKALYSENRGSR